jgi:uncharacterized membrane protein YuzA (DUF378 family)
MTPFRPSRRRLGPDPHLQLKMGLFMAAAAAALVGMLTGNSLFIYLAIGLLAVGVLLRLRRGPQDDDEHEEDAED